VLGWLLAGLAEMPFGKLWVFKGGTCIKKCYFETYRFSEDLDFSLLPDAAYTQEVLTRQLREFTAPVAELSGLEFSPDLIDVKTRRNQQGQPTFEGRVAYRGPLVFPGSPKIRFDFTQHEVVIDEVADRPVLHPYPDEFPPGTTVRAYSFNELLAEKTRALLERSRPRDLYDIVHLIENAPSDLDFNAVHTLFRQKCGSKNISVPSSGALVAAVSGDAELRSEWANMRSSTSSASRSRRDVWETTGVAGLAGLPRAAAPRDTSRARAHSDRQRPNRCAGHPVLGIEFATGSRAVRGQQSAPRGVRLSRDASAR
jgi:predicted nucleotidyltransferase component of viral defense system